MAREVPVGTEPGTSRSLFEVICAECGKRTQVPFKPLTGKPILCKDCFVQKKQRMEAEAGVKPPVTEGEDTGRSEDSILEAPLPPITTDTDIDTEATEAPKPESEESIQDKDEKPPSSPTGNST